MTRTPLPPARVPFPEVASTPVAAALHPSVVWRTAGPDALDAQYEGRAEGFAYARESHPNATRLAAQLDALEGAPEAFPGGGLMFGSGMGAVAAVLLGLLSPGERIAAASQLYGRTLRLLREDLPRFGIGVDWFDPTDAASLDAALRPETRMIWLETVSNPTLRVADLAAARAAARRTGARLALDNTFTTPRGFAAFAFGADVVVHSVTKMLAGHSDATLGWAAARDPADRARLIAAQGSYGATASPFDCWLAERGLATFALRYDAAEANAAALAALLPTLPGVAQVLHPGRPDHPDHARARALLGNRFGTMVAFRLAGGRPAVQRFLDAAPELPFGPSLGDVQTLISHPPSSSHRALTPEGRAALGIDEGFLRVSVGVEDRETLLAAIRRGVAAAAAG